MERLLDQLMAEDDDGAWRRCRARAGGIHPPGHRDVLTVRRAFGAVGVRIDDGEFTVVNHAGDNVLGGKQRQAGRLGTGG